LRREGFTGALTLIGDEPCEPYHGPPLSKQVLDGWVPGRRTALPRQDDLDAEWRLGVRATGLDLARKRVLLADGEEAEFNIRPAPDPLTAHPRHSGRDPDPATMIGNRVGRRTESSCGGRRG